MYFGDAISDPYYEGERGDTGKHPCRRCGLVRLARKPWTFCADCIQIDPEMCGARGSSGKPRRTRFEEEFDEYDDSAYARPDQRATAAA